MLKNPRAWPISWMATLSKSIVPGATPSELSKSKLKALLNLIVPSITTPGEKAEVGLVAGDVARGVGRLFARFEGDSDGTVGVEETRLPGLADHCVVHSSHTGLVFSREAVAQAAHFLRHGRFERRSEHTGEPPAV